MRSNNVRLALASVRAAKWRSFLTMLGVILGVISVVTIISLGEGVKREITGQINHLGEDLLTIRPGKTITRDDKGNVKSVNVVAAFTQSGSLSENDLKVVEKNANVSVAVPLSQVTGIASVNGKEFDSGFVVGTTSGLPKVLKQKVAYGAFFGPEDQDANVAIIGEDVAIDLFREPVPMGKTLTIRGQNFVVRGVFEKFNTSPLTPGSDYNYAIFIPLGAAKALGGQAQIQEILTKPNSPAQTQAVASELNTALKASHGGQEDFTVLQQRDNLAIADKVFNVMVGLIGGIAAISLIVGGIGIMNIMLVSVSERTHEIGIRKAIGATTNQILSQFMVESAVLSVLGGIFGVILSAIINYFMRIFTNLQPVLTLRVILLAVGMALVVGIIFGVAPALKAARKDPIESLRYGN